jgi:hypothetical protein
LKGFGSGLRHVGDSGAYLPQSRVARNVRLSGQPELQRFAVVTLQLHAERAAQPVDAPAGAIGYAAGLDHR